MLARPTALPPLLVLLAGLAAACEREDRPVRGLWTGDVETRGAPVTRAILSGPAQCRMLRHRDQDLVLRVEGTSPGPARVRIAANPMPTEHELAQAAGAFRRELRVPRAALGDADWVTLEFDRNGLVVEALEIVETARPRVVVLGLDALTWRVLDPLLAAGRLPHFERLIRDGASGPLESADPLLSPVVWTTIATGQGHGAHGIHGFVDEEHKLVSSRAVKVKRVWELVGEHGRATVGVAGWFVTWPAEAVNGFMLSDRAASITPGDRERPLSFAPGFLQDAFDPVARERRRRYLGELPRFTPLQVDAEWRTQFQPGTPAYEQRAALDPVFLPSFLRDSSFVESGVRLLEALRPDLFLVYLRGADHAQHAYWFHRAPGESLTPVDAEARRLFGGIIDGYYVYLDEALGRFMAAAPPDTTFMVVSDHGFRSELRGRGEARRAAAHHEAEGVYVFSGPAFRRGIRGRPLSIFDLTPLWLHLYGLPAARDMRGRLPLDLLAPGTSPELERIDSYGRHQASGGPGDARESAADPEIVEQLKALGYIQ